MTKIAADVASFHFYVLLRRSFLSQRGSIIVMEFRNVAAVWLFSFNETKFFVSFQHFLDDWVIESLGDSRILQEYAKATH